MEKIFNGHTKEQLRNLVFKYDPFLFKKDDEEIIGKITNVKKVINIRDLMRIYVAISDFDKNSAHIKKEVLNKYSNMLTYIEEDI